MIGVNEIKGVRITSEINFEKDIGEDYHQHLTYPTEYPANIAIHQEKPAVPVPLHWHNGGEIIYSRNWNLIVVINGIRHTLKPGDFILIGPCILHAIHPEQREDTMEVMSVTMDVETLAKINPRLRYCGILSDISLVDETIRSEMVDLFESLFYEAVCSEENREFMINSILFHILQVIVDHFLTEDEGRQKRVGERENRLKEILTYLDENYRESLSTRSVAEHFGYNREYFCRIFKKYSNMTFKEYLTSIRIEAVVEQMKKTDESCARIAIAEGFPDVKGFNSAFKKRYGLSPNQYRKKYINRSGG